MRLYPYKFEAIYKERIWGGRNLQRLFGRDLPAGVRIGESWELSDIPEGASVVANGPNAGRSLTELVSSLGGKLLGRAAAMPDGRFPVLLKLLDAEDILSLQVHPDASAARAIGDGAAAKSECWYILESRGGFIYKGLCPGVTAEQFRRAVEANQAETVVRRMPVAAGDFHYLPAGVVHALGAGVVVAEVQTPSDTTYRVTDWGRGRETHMEKSMQAIHFDQAGAESCPPAGENVTLLTSEFFTVARRQINGAAAVPLPGGRCCALMILKSAGGCEIRHAGSVEPVTSVLAGDTILLPAGLESAALVARGLCAWLEITLPETP
ncbi:MAG: type I phosphomannose isomerase catalytic subunit [Phycisphaerae bacterium]|jgi:mannose-6-phosphate isomerase